MESLPGPWELAVVTAKLLLYLGLSGVLGGLFMAWLSAPGQLLPRNFLYVYLVLSALTALLASAFFFFAQVGAINQRGPGGMLDWTIAGILASTGLGYGSALRAGLCLLLISLLCIPRIRHRLPGAAPGWLLILAPLTGLSFALLGHVAALELAARAAIVLHVAFAFIWAGSLPVLHRLCRTAPSDPLQKVMERFSRLAVAAVALLALAGLFILLRLLADFPAAELPAVLAGSAYGRALFLKLALVALLLCLAALNRYRLVPALRVERRPLRLAIRGEMIVMPAVFLLTALLSTVLSPPH